MALIDPTQLSKLRELAVDDDDFVASVIDAFLPQLESVPAALRQALADADEQAVVDLAHSLKGSAANVGAEDVARLCLSIEQLARGADLGGVPPLVDELETTAAATRGVFEAEKRRRASGGG